MGSKRTNDPWSKIKLSWFNLYNISCFILSLITDTKICTCIWNFEGRGKYPDLGRDHPEENCVHVYPNGNWNNAYCNEPRGYICSGPLPSEGRISFDSIILTKLQKFITIETDIIKIKNIFRELLRHKSL